jgi:predicted nucleic acid-binding protein
VITGDADLLMLDPFHDIAIITPRAFVDRAPTLSSRG